MVIARDDWNAASSFLKAAAHWDTQIALAALRVAVL
jgi:hypothetical protein